MSFLFSSSVYSKRRFPDQDLALRGVWRVKKISFTFSKSFSLSVHSLFKEMFSWPRSGSQGCLTGQENIFLPSASLFSFRPPSIQGDVFYPRNGKSTTVNNCQWSRHRLQTERTRLKLSFEWPIPHHGGKYLSQKMSISRLWDCLI